MLPIIVVGVAIANATYDIADYLFTNHTETGRKAAQDEINRIVDPVVDRINPRLIAVEDLVGKTHQEARRARVASQH